MLASIIFSWVFIFLYPFFIVVTLLSYRGNPQRPKTKALLGLIFVLIISTAAIIGLVVALVRSIDLAKTHLFFVFLIAFFVVQLINQWTTNYQPRSKGMRILLIAETAFVACYAVLMLGIFVFNF